jgi:hypothetical protein
MHLKNVIKEKRMALLYIHTVYYTGPPCVQAKIFILEYLFLGVFCHSGKFIFLKSM